MSDTPATDATDEAELLEPVEGCLITTMAPLLWYFHFWTTSTLWQWFAVPLGLAPVTVLQAMALHMMVSWWRPRYLVPQTKTIQGKRRFWRFIAIRPFIALGVGWVMKWLWW